VPSGSSDTGPSNAKLGWMTINAPANPNSTAAIRRQPTVSRRKTTDSKVRISGSTKNTAIASASGMYFTARKNSRLAGENAAANEVEQRSFRPQSGDAGNCNGERKRQQHLRRESRKRHLARRHALGKPQAIWPPRPSAE
jgi:hypothetical protein